MTGLFSLVSLNSKFDPQRRTMGLTLRITRKSDIFHITKQPVLWGASLERKDFQNGDVGYSSVRADGCLCTFMFVAD